MTQFQKNPPPYKSSKDAKEEWKSFSKGLNLLARPTEISNEELQVADNILLTGIGVPTGRWGTATYFTANTTGSVRGFVKYKNKTGTVNELMALTDEGYLAKKDGSGSSRVSGQSWPSGSIIRSEQLGNKTYIVSENVTFTEYNGTNLIAFATISAPTGVAATNFSGASGPASMSYKVVAIGSNGGQTTPSANYVLANLPNDLTKTQVHLFWSAPSAATISGYEVYRGLSGNETFLAAVGTATTKYIDNGDAASQVIEPPLTNTTGGVKSKFIAKYKDRVLVVPADDPNKLMISGRYPNHTKFSWLNGGGYIYVDPDSGDNISGLAVQPIADRIVTYKEHSSYLVELKVITIGNFAVLDPQYVPLSTFTGCTSQDSIAVVENDIFSFGREGIFANGYRANFLNIVMTNEISAKMRPYFALLNEDDYRTANAFYVNNKYILSFPQRKEMIVFDRERGAFLGPWRLPYGISHMSKYIDETGTERWVIGSAEDNQVYTFDAAVNSDNGQIIVRTLRTKKSDFGDWTRLYILKLFYILFRAIVGATTVNIIIEDRQGSIRTVKSFTITGAEVGGSTGWGMRSWGMEMWGLPQGTRVSVASEEITRWATLFKQARLFQIEVISNTANSNFELLEAKMTAARQSAGSLSSSQRV